MQKLRHVLGLPVLETNTGKQVGEVSEVMVDISRTVLLGFIVAGDNVEDGFIPFEDVFSLGEDAIMLSNQKKIRSLETLQSISDTYPLAELFDKAIFTEAGLRLGMLVDIMIDKMTGEIKWYQLSESVLGDLLYGRLIMPLPQAQMIGEDKIIVPEIMSKLLHKDGDHNEMQSLT